MSCAVLAAVVAKNLPTGLEFARYSIDYHYLRNRLFVEGRMGSKRALRHVPGYASALMAPYSDELAALEAARASVARGRNRPNGSQPTGQPEGIVNGFVSSSIDKMRSAWKEALKRIKR